MATNILSQIVGLHHQAEVVNEPADPNYQDENSEEVLHFGEHVAIFD